jgi:DNA-binding CsgD family transcriptional regulator/tetratricopeptide (TPR) repeat protein
MRPLHSSLGGNSHAAADLSVAVGLARGAWLRGDVAAVVAALEVFDLGKEDAPDRAEAVLLYGRALLRSQRPLEAKQLLAPVLSTFDDADVECTARMLHGVAVARCNSPDEGLALLRETAEHADRLTVHRAVRLEITYYRALSHWVKRELTEAAAYAYVVEAARVDVLSVRAMELLGFVAIAEERYPDALQTFQQALAAYRACRERDTALVEQILVQIATLEAQLRSAAVSGSYQDASARRVPGDVFRSSTSLGRSQIAWLDAWQFAHDGDARSALRSMREAESVAPTPAWMVFALAGRASISTGFGEVENAREQAMHAVRITEGIDWQKTRGEERFALILLAEALGRIDPSEAARALTRFDAISSKIDDVLFAGTDPRKAALEAYVRGLVALHLGERQRARLLLDEGYRGFRACGHLWRAALALIEIDATLSSSGKDEFHLESAALLVHEHFPNSFLARRLGRWGGVYSNPIAKRLTPAQRQILRYALDGYGAKDIATVTGRSVKTVGNQLATLHQAFGVNSTLRLVAECHRHGLGSPSWAGPSSAAPLAARTDDRLAV